ncbi:MAG: enoyl-CoA hydratase-related protein [Halofilum sp. (in: g-proteobacteria)]|nr:enoyl-CoA hydratase-related protein [Halofilum sp. (in: g-proteobacteria)]
MSTPRLQHARLEHDDDAIAWLTLDVADANANTLSSAVLGELEKVLDTLEDEPPTALVLRSGKPGFIAGANVQELAGLRSAEEARALIERGQRLMDRIAATRWPTIALIRGFCMGGGLELALACRYRIADTDPGTRLGLPEVRLGIHPGFGGTARLPDLVGPPAALDLMLSGRTIDARAARRHRPGRVRPAAVAAARCRARTWRCADPVASARPPGSACSPRARGAPRCARCWSARCASARGASTTRRRTRCSSSGHVTAASRSRIACAPRRIRCSAWSRARRRPISSACMRCSSDRLRRGARPARRRRRGACT